MKSKWTISILFLFEKQIQYIREEKISLSQFQQHAKFNNGMLLR